EWNLVKSERNSMISGWPALGACLFSLVDYIPAICTTISSFFAISLTTYMNGGEKIFAEDTGKERRIGLPGHHVADHSL
ncbi:MAG: hypothetical protein ABSE73_23895, partial [Planctomycetota bacterium]